MLKSNGAESELIKILLRDARLLGWLNKLLEDQIVILETLQGNYKKKNWSVLHEQDKYKTEGDVQSFGDEIVSLDKQVHEKFRSLTSTSQDLIQLVKLSMLTLRLPANYCDRNLT